MVSTSSASQKKTTSTVKPKKRTGFLGWYDKDVAPYVPWTKKFQQGMAKAGDEGGNPFSSKGRAALKKSNPITGTTALQNQDWGSVFDNNKGGVSPGAQLLTGLSPALSLLWHNGGLKSDKPKTKPKIGNTGALDDYFPNGQGMTQDSGLEDAGPPQFTGGSLQDYLDKILAAGGGGASGSYDGSDIAQQLAALERARADTRNSAATGDAKLASMYGALKNITDADNTAAQARFQQAQKDSAALTANGEAAIQGSNAAAQNAQNTIRNNLGISTPDANLPQGPTDAQQTQAGYAKTATSGNQAIGNAAGQNIIAGGLAQGDYGAKMGTAAQFGGLNRRADLQTELQKALAQIGMSEAELRDSSVQRWQQRQDAAKSDAFNQAQALRDSDYSQWKDSRDFEANRDDQYWDRSQATQATPNLQGGDAILGQLQQAGIPAQSQSKIMDVIYGGLATGADPKTGAKVTPYAGVYRAIQDAVAAGTLTSAEAAKALQTASSVFAPK